MFMIIAIKENIILCLNCILFIADFYIVILFS